MANATAGSNAQFTYDFGISIAQSTVRKITALTGATLSLASAFYALKTTASEYVDSLRKNTFLFGGVLGTMKAIEQAQQRLIKGLSYFDPKDQLEGMNRLMAAGVQVRENLDWINKAAHASGQSFAQFSGAIASAIAGNMGQLVDMGLITQRATRMFEKYAANTIQREKAIINFLRTHKGLSAAIRNDFETIEDQTKRINSVWNAFLKSIVGKPNDPNSLYGQTVYAMKLIAEANAQNLERMKKAGYVIGHVLGWVVRNVGHFITWLGRQVRNAIRAVGITTDNYVEFTRSLLVWLEFLKLKLIDVFRTMAEHIKNAVLAIKKFTEDHPILTKIIITLGALAVAWKLVGARILYCYALQKRYIAFQGPALGKFAVWLQSLAAWLPKPFRTAWVFLGKWISRAFVAIKGWILMIPGLASKAFAAIKGLFVAFNATNPVGWIILAISLITTLYATCKPVRKFINGMFKMVWELIKMAWNLLYGMFTFIIRIGKGIWNWITDKSSWLWEHVKMLGSWIYDSILSPIGNFLGFLGDGIKSLWHLIKDSSVVRWLKNNIIDPLSNFFSNVLDFFKGLGSAIAGGPAAIANWLAEGNTALAGAVNKDAESLGLPKLGAEGRKYDENDTTNYLNPKNWFSKSGGNAKKEDKVPTNPILDVSSAQSFGGSGKVVNNNWEYKTGAIQIIVHKGEQIDEYKLSKVIKDTVLDMRRETNMRGGSL